MRKATPEPKPEGHTPQDPTSNAEVELINKILSEVTRRLRYVGPFFPGSPSPLARVPRPVLIATVAASIGDPHPPSLSTLRRWKGKLAADWNVWDLSPWRRFQRWSDRRHKAQAPPPQE